MDPHPGLTINPVEQLHKKPAKGILKTSSSFETAENSRRYRRSADKATKWDEMNIIATLHPPDKDYGHMKVDEPKTPFERNVPDDELDSGVDPSLLSQRMQSIDPENPIKLKVQTSETDDDDDMDHNETPEQIAARKEFEKKRKAHYNEFQAVRMARQLLEEEEEDEENVNEPVTEYKVVEDTVSPKEDESGGGGGDDAMECD